MVLVPANTPKGSVTVGQDLAPLLICVCGTYSAKTRIKPSFIVPVPPAPTVLPVNVY